MLHLNHFIQQCHSNLISNKNEEVLTALEYLQNERHLSLDTIKSNHIGYCNSTDVISNEIKFFGKETDSILNGNGYAPFIQGRVVVPVYAEFGNIVGFATRKPSPEKGNTWWNLSKPFRKGHHLFMLDKNRKDIFENNKIYLVEGYMDAIILRQEGLRGVVSIMGTTLSPRKIGLMARYCNNVCVCLDVDENQSGQKGQEKIIYLLKKFDFCDWVISIIDGLPVKEDPDKFVIKNGLQSFLSKEKILTPKEIGHIYNKVLNNSKGRE